MGKIKGSIILSLMITYAKKFHNALYYKFFGPRYETHYLLIFPPMKRQLPWWYEPGWFLSLLLIELILFHTLKKILFGDEKVPRPSKLSMVRSIAEI